MRNNRTKLKRWLKQAAYNNKKLYVLSRVLKEFSTERLYELLWGHYEYTPEYTSVIIEHPGELYPNDIVLYISNGEIPRERAGFFAVMRATLNYLYYADSQGFTPVVRWGKYSRYYDLEMDAVTKNAFEYYFKPVSHISYEEALHVKNLIRANGSQFKNMEYDLDIDEISYNLGKDELKRLSAIYKKYCRLNEMTREYVKKELSVVINGKRTLGVHARGTDFKVRAARHPVFVTPEEYLQATKNLLSTGKYEQVFLATDDKEILELFQREIPKGQFVFYPDVERGSGYITPHIQESQSPLYKYRLGLEVLRDVYTLACCDGFIGGLSQVGFAARYINLGLGRTFEDSIIIDKGVLTKASKIGKEYAKMLQAEVNTLEKMEINEHGKNT